MSNEKSTGKTAGSISKYRQLGGGKHSEVEKSETPNVQTSESPDIQQSKSENIQTAETLSTQSVESPSVQQSKTSEVQSSESVKGQNMNSLAVQTEKGTHKGFAADFCSAVQDLDMENLNPSGLRFASRSCDRVFESPV